MTIFLWPRRCSWLNIRIDVQEVYKAAVKTLIVISSFVLFEREKPNCAKPVLPYCKRRELQKATLEEKKMI